MAVEVLVNGFGTSFCDVVNAKCNSMGEVVEGGVHDADDNSPLEGAIEKVHTELRQKFCARDETIKELEFLEKGGNLLDYKVNVDSVSFQSNLVVDQQNDQLVTNEPKWDFVSVTPSHGDSVECRDGPVVVSIDAKSADSRLLVSETEFDKRGHGLSHCCESDIVPLEQPLQVNRAQKHVDLVGFDLSGKAYKRRNRSRPSCDRIRSVSADVAPAHGGHAMLPSHHGSGDLKSLECGELKHNMDKMVAFSMSVSPSDGAIVKNETSGLQQCHDFDSLKCNKSMENSFEGVSKPRNPDLSSLCVPMDTPSIQEMQTGDFKSSEKMSPTGPEEIQVIGKKASSSYDYQLGLPSGEVDNQIIAHEVNDFKIPGEEENRNGAMERISFSHETVGLQSKSISSATGQYIDGSNGAEMGAAVQSIHSCNIHRNEGSPNRPSCVKGSEQRQNSGLVKWYNQNCSQSLHETGSLHEQAMGAVGPKHSDRNHDDPLAVRNEMLDEISCLNNHQDSVDTKSSSTLRGELSSVIDSAGFIDEDSVLKEAQIVEEKRKRFAAVSVVTSKVEIRRRSQWDYVLEEMAWLSNDFAQERMWKMTAAAQISCDAVVACQLQRDKNSCVEAKKENIFYTAPSGAMETYKKSVLTHLAHIGRYGHCVQEEAVISACDGVTDFESRDNAYGEDEGETNAFNMPFTFDDSNPSRYGRKKLKHLKHWHGIGLSEVDSDLLVTEVKLVNQQSSLSKKRPGRTLHAPVPAKRIRTSSRKIISPLSLRTSAPFQLQSKTDASSCDTNSLQDDQSALHGGLVFRSTLEVDSVRDFEKQCQFESMEVSMVPKKEKSKHMSPAYNQQWQVDSGFHEEQVDHFRRRAKNHLVSNRDTGVFCRSNVKKPKVLKQSRDSSDNFPQLCGSGPSPVTSQSSDMHDTHKFVKILGGQHQGREVKGPKTPVGEPRSANPWSVLSDQALVVLVHDLGPNWELVSDAFNSMFHFKHTFHIAKEFKERYYILMDRGSGDGADSAEDSGSSKPCPSALPGIPKGSARQLFQHLLGPVEEDSIKFRFEKIIMIGETQSFRRSQLKGPQQIQQPHSSLSKVLSRCCPSNLNGVSILTPLDLCDVPDVAPTRLQGSPNVGLAANQGISKPKVSATIACSALQVQPNMIGGNSMASSPGHVNSSVRDGRHAVPRCVPLPAEEQQNIQRHNPMMPGRNTSHTNSFLMASPGSMVGSPNMHSGVGTVHGSNLSRPCDGLPLMRSGVNQDSPRQVMMSPDLHMQGVSHFGSLNSPIPSLTAPPMVSYGIHHQLPLPLSPPQRHQSLNSPDHATFQGQPSDALSQPQQQAYAIRLAKERRRQQMLLGKQQPQLQQQFASSNLIPPVQPRSKVPMPSTLQAASQAQTRKSSPVPLSPLPPSSSMNSVPHQQKGHVPAVGVLNNQEAGGSV